MELETLLKFASRRLDRDLQPEEISRLTKAVNSHLSPLLQHEKCILILGSYEDEKHERLELVKEALNSQYRYQASSRAYPYLMSDIGGEDDVWINYEIKFRFLADAADYIVGVAEDDSGGFLFEQGILTTEDSFRQKTVLLKREYGSSKLEHANFSAMQSNGVFQKLDRQGQLYRWSDLPSLHQSVEQVFEHFEKK